MRITLLFMLSFMLLGCDNYYNGPDSKHYKNNHFFNPNNPMTHKLFGFLRWQLTNKSVPWPTPAPIKATDKPPRHVNGNQLRISFVGHDTVLLQTQGLNILTDPIWSERASPVTWAGPKRVTAPGINFNDLPKIDVIIISHNHYDHMDLPTIKKIWQRDQPRIIVPLGNDTIIKNYATAIKVEAYDWQQKITINANTAIYLLPTQHWSARSLFDRDKALWAAYAITTPGGNIYFAGDTGYGSGENFIKARQQFGEFRLALLPIGAYEPRWFMAYSHMNPTEAVLAYRNLNAKYALGIHFGTFHLADEGYQQPLQDLAAAEKNYLISPQRFRALPIGQAWEVPQN